MNELKLFNYGMQEVRTVIKDGEPWFVAKDIGEILEYKDIPSMSRYLDSDEKMVFEIGELTSANLSFSNKARSVLLLNEAGLYSLILRSRKPEAKEFKRWITHEVIPSIRKHGAYMTESTLDEMVNNPV